MKADQSGREPGSYRDPRGQVYLVDGRVYRTVMPVALEDYRFVEESGFLEELIESGSLVDRLEVDGAVLGGPASEAAVVLEHPRLPFISYPYEWSFEGLKAAAIFHLRIQLAALEKGVTLSDASAYNVQFDGVQPIFIDHLSFKRYREGEYWEGHRQFCEQFLNPLLLRAKVGIAHNAWYRGTLEGIATEDLARMLPGRCKLSLNTLLHVLMPARFQARARSAKGSAAVRKQNLPKAAFERMLEGLMRWIENLEPVGSQRTDWGDYSESHSYAPGEYERKKEFVASYCGAAKPKMLWDLGCNTGDFSSVALSFGAERVIGFDLDHRALDAAFVRAREEGLGLLPLFLDVTNPPPNQGWAEAERAGLSRRSEADGLLALALIHHIAIARNVPLPSIIDWFTGMAPSGVIEFVPKKDPMVAGLLRLREDVFPDYQEEVFESLLQSRARIQHAKTISSSGRKLYWYVR